jgi:hypothetical protein
MAEIPMRPCAEFAEEVLKVHDLAGIDAVEVHGVRAVADAGTEPVIDNQAPERFSTYFRQKAGGSVRCGDFTEDWAAQEYAAALSDQYNLPVVDHALAALLDQEPVESTEHMSCPPGM